MLNTHCQPLPVGVIGELHIGGAGLGRGYLNKPELTAERFIANPYASELDKVKGYTRLYKTGDLVRWLADGNLEYLGRNDFQVKIRGYRIELGEIEHALSRYAGIQQSVVLVKEEAREQGINKSLVAYYISAAVIDEALLCAHLSASLPEYMIPGFFVWMASFPLTINGKLDRNALPSPELRLDARCYVAARTELESTMCSIWESVLGVERVGIEDDFFRLGGNSLLVTQLVSRMNKLFEINVVISDIFKYKSIYNIVSGLINNRHYSIIKMLNIKHNDLPRMYFIHPGSSGCEIYQSLADLLEDSYQSIGIDNFNIYYDNKIDNLSNIADLYINKIEKIFPFPDQINLCGWSLGGQIALEIAYKLEQKGLRKIKVYLLDTLLNDNHLRSLRSSLDMNDIQECLKVDMLKQNFDEYYIEKICSASNAEVTMSNNDTGILLYTEVLLFKATEPRGVFKTENHIRMEEYICSLRDNNIQAVVVRPIKIERLRCHHGDILKKTKDIIRCLLSDSWVV